MTGAGIIAIRPYRGTENGFNSVYSTSQWEFIAKESWGSADGK